MGDAPRLVDAIELAFPMDTDDAVLYWNGIPVPINYKYDLSVIWDDVLDILSHFLEDKKIKTWFASNTLTTQWTVDTQNEIVKIHANWRTIVGKNKSQLTQSPDIEVPKSHFLKQWSGLLETAIAGVSRTTLIIEDPQQQNEAESLIQKISGL
ncbi:MAG: hypothetical protein ACQ9MH_14050 [Nitrospinales bacterium]